jgi:hypothetical protein
MKVKKSWKTVTPLSKAIALALFISLPIVAFVFGAKWQKLRDMAVLTETYNQLRLDNRQIDPMNTVRPVDNEPKNDQMLYINGTPMPAGL